MPRVLGAERAGSGPRRHLVGALGCFVALGLGLGAAAGVLWSWLVELPTYRVGSDGGATTSERGLADFLGSDAWFSILGAGVGLVIGLLAWWRFHRMGWPVVLVSTLTATAAALVCWLVGTLLGPGDFDTRLAAAKPDDLVPISLALRAKTSLLVWPFLAVVPVLVGSSLGADEEESDAAQEEPSVGHGA